MLLEKQKQYGVLGGFYDTNADGDYSHAIGETILKCKEFVKSHNRRMLIKAVAWLYLIYEAEDHIEPR